MTQRLHATVMFTDIVGFTALMGSDEDRAYEVIRKNREIHKKCISKFNGTLIKEMGDGMLISFELASTAVRCAIEIQKACAEQDIPLKIGIHESEMVFEGNDLLGDGVNIASRIQDDTKGGCISISGSVYRDVSNQSDIHTEFISEKRFKNVAEDIKIYNVLWNQLGISTAPALHQATPNTKSIAVLPFINMSNDTEQEYFCDGLTEEIINVLTRLKKLKVIARTSVFEFKNKNEDIRRIGKRLDVGFLLEGSVRKAGNRLRITAQLIDVTDGSHLWSDRFDREMKDIFEIQDEISLAIVDNLKVELLEQQKEKVSERRTENVAAYNLYLKGLFHWYKRTNDGMTRSIEYFRRALELDDQFAPAYSGIAGSYIAMADWGEKLPNEALPIARENLERSLEIDDALAETFALFAYLNLCEWKFEECRQNVEKALELNQDLAVAHHYAGLYNYIITNSTEAIAHNLKARELDPLNLIFNFAYGFILYGQSRLDAALRQFRETLRIDSTFMPPMLWSFYIYVKLGQFQEAVNQFHALLSCDHDSSEEIRESGKIFKSKGMTGFLQWVIDEGLTYYKRPYNHSYHRAICYALANDKSKAIESLEEADNLNAFRLTFLKTESAFDGLITHPFYQKLLLRWD